MENSNGWVGPGEGRCKASCIFNHCIPQMKDTQNNFLRKMEKYPFLLRLNDSRNGVVAMSAPMKGISLGVLNHVHGMIDHVLKLLQSDDDFWKEFVEVRSCYQHFRIRVCIDVGAFVVVATGFRNLHTKQGRLVLQREYCNADNAHGMLGLPVVSDFCSTQLLNHVHTIGRRGKVWNGTPRSWQVHLSWWPS